MGNSIETKKSEATMRGKYLNPKADMTFKLVFGEHPDRCTWGQRNGVFAH